MPTDGIHLILRNKLAGNKLWPSKPSPPVVLSTGEFVQRPAVGDPVAVTTQALSKSVEEQTSDNNEVLTKTNSLPLPDLSALSFPLFTDQLINI